MDLSTVLPGFDPVNGKIDIHRWIDKIEEYADMYGWDDIATKHYALSKLEGVARTWKDSLERGNRSWEDWKTLLSQTFLIEETGIKKVLEAQNYKRKCGQNIVEYFYEKLSRCINARMGTREIIEWIVHGLDSFEYRSYLGPLSRYGQPTDLLADLRSGDNFIREHSRPTFVKEDGQQNEQNLYQSSTREKTNKTRFRAEEETVIPKNYLGHINVVGDYKRLQDTFESLKSENAILKNENHKLKTSNEKLKAELGLTKIQKEILKAELSEVTNEATRLKDNLDQCRTDTDTLKDDQGKANKEIKSLRIELGKLKSQSANTQIQKSHENSKSATKNLEVQLTTSQEDKHKLIENIEALRSKIVKLRKNQAADEAAKESLFKEYSATKSELEALKNDLEKENTEAKKLKSELDKLKYKGIIAIDRLEKIFRNDRSKAIIEDDDYHQEGRIGANLLYQ